MAETEIHVKIRAGLMAMRTNTESPICVIRLTVLLLFTKKLENILTNQR